MDQQHFPFFSETISEYCLFGNVISFHGYVSAVQLQPSETLRKAWKELCFKIEKGKIKTELDQEKQELFETLLDEFYTGIGDDLEHQVLNPKFFLELLDVDMNEGATLWAQGFIYGARFQGRGFLEKRDPVISDIMFPIVLQVSEQGETDKLYEVAPEFNPEEVKQDALNHIEDALTELYTTLRGEVKNIDGSSTEDGPVGRNDPCPCGSGKKYKKCCLLNN